MAFRILDCEQRSADWFQARLGKLTGSRAGDMLATIKTGEAAARRDLRMQLLCERLTNTSQEDGYVNAVMQRGIDLEPEARAAYEVLTGNLVQEVGFVEHNTVQAGCSPDGYVGEFDGLVSIKCPKSATHLLYLRSQTIPTEYLGQVLHELWITGARWYHFVSYDSRFPEPLQLKLIHYTRDDAAIAEYEQKALAFLAELDRETYAIQALAAVAVPA